MHLVGRKVSVALRDAPLVPLVPSDRGRQLHLDRAILVPRRSVSSVAIH
jgi:hypothetical protein